MINLNPQLRYFYFRYRFWPVHRHKHGILQQHTTFHPNRSTQGPGRSYDVMWIFQDGCRISPNSDTKFGQFKETFSRPYPSSCQISLTSVKWVGRNISKIAHQIFKKKKRIFKCVPSPRKFLIFAHPVYFQGIRVKFVYEGHPVKVNSRSRSRSGEQNTSNIPFPRSTTSIGNNSASIPHKAVKFVCSIGFLDMADRIVWSPSLPSDRICGWSALD